MDLCKTVLLICLATCAIASAQQPADSPTSTAPAVELQQRPETKSKPAPPAPLWAPQTMEAAKLPNANAIYQTLRQRTASGPSFRVKDLILKRDAGELHLTDG